MRKKRVVAHLLERGGGSTSDDLDKRGKKEKKKVQSDLM